MMRLWSAVSDEIFKVKGYKHEIKQNNFSSYYRRKAIFKTLTCKEELAFFKKGDLEQ